jgi:hypothetical protein
VFIKNHPNLFQTLQTKAIARVHVSAVDVEEVRDWFYGFRSFCKEHGIKARDVLNFNKAGFRIGVAPREEIVIPAYVQEVSLLFLIYNNIY